MINAVELEREISNAYTQWNPIYHDITGRYADGAIREVSYRRVSPVGNFIVSCECYIDREKNVNWTRNLRMYFTQADWKSMAEWISMVSEHLNVKEITIREYQYDAFAVLDAPYLSIYRSLEFFSLLVMAFSPLSHERYLSLRLEIGRLGKLLNLTVYRQPSLTL